MDPDGTVACEFSKGGGYEEAASRWSAMDQRRLVTAELQMLEAGVCDGPGAEMWIEAGSWRS